MRKSSRYILFTTILFGGYYLLQKDFNPLTDVRASSSYRKLVSKNLMDRLFLEINNNKVGI